MWARCCELGVRVGALRLGRAAPQGTFLELSTRSSQLLRTTTQHARRCRSARARRYRLSARLLGCPSISSAFELFDKFNTAFVAFDLDGDGTITVSELASATRSLGQQAPPRPMTP